MGDGGFFKMYGALISYFEDFCAAGLFCKFISKQEFHKMRGELIEDKWFYYTREQIQKDFYISEHLQRGMIKKFEDAGLVESIIFKNSIPQKKYYSVNFEKLIEVLSR